MVVAGSVVSIFLFRKFLTNEANMSLTFTLAIAGAVNAVQIQIFNFLYGMLSVRLNDWENHRTDTQFENSLIGKAFLFKFINSYNSFFYIAFVKKNDSGVGYCKGSWAGLQGRLFSDSEK